MSKKIKKYAQNPNVDVDDIMRTHFKLYLNALENIMWKKIFIPVR